MTSQGRSPVRGSDFFWWASTHRWCMTSSDKRAAGSAAPAAAAHVSDGRWWPELTSRTYLARAGRWHGRSVTPWAGQSRLASTTTRGRARGGVQSTAKYTAPRHDPNEHPLALVRKAEHLYRGTHTRQRAPTEHGQPTLSPATSRDRSRGPAVGRAGGSGGGGGVAQNSVFHLLFNPPTVPPSQACLRRKREIC